MTTLRDRLAKYDQPWADTPDPMERLPDGEYAAQLQSWQIREDGEFPRLLLVFSCLEPDYEDQAIFISQSFDPQRLKWMKELLYSMGVDPMPKPSEIPDVIDNYHGTKYLLMLRTKGKYQNAYVQRKIDGPLTTASGAPSVSDDDIPF